VRGYEISNGITLKLERFKPYLSFTNMHTNWETHYKLRGERLAGQLQA
jgi:hypothetical protein